MFPVYESRLKVSGGFFWSGLFLRGEAVPANMLVFYFSSPLQGLLCLLNSCLQCSLYMKAVRKFWAAFWEAGCFWEGRLFQRTCWHFIFPPLFKGFCAYWILVCNVPCIWKPSESFGRLFEKRAVFEREGCSSVTCWYFIFPPFFKGFCAYWILVCNVPCIWKPSEMFQAAFFEAGCF